MKNQLSPSLVIGAISVVAIIVIAAAVMYFRSDAGGGPPLKPKPWKPPSQWSGAPGPGAPKAPTGP